MSSAAVRLFAERALAVNPSFDSDEPAESAAVVEICRRLDGIALAIELAAADGDELMNVVLFWRDEIPAGWEPPPGALSPRIEGQQPATIGDPKAVGNRVLVGYSGADPAFTPRGVQKFEWDPIAQSLGEAWVNTDVGSANSVPIVSADLSAVYTVGARNGQWTLEALDWTTGESAFHWVTGSSRYNTLFSGLNIDQDGRIVHTTMFGIVRNLL